jgi:isopentenyl-diphosphate Delta-isomerase
MLEEVILVDEFDNAIGKMEKLEAHQKGVLHRAFSIFIFNDKNEMLLQRRAFEKYHSAGLWTNTCCSHPRPNESNIEAANRRLKEEMGMEAALTHKTFFIYKTEFDNSLTEYELDHVFVGHSNKNPNINLDEVESYIWLSVQDIKDQINLNPKQFTSWFKIAINKLF